MRTVSCGVSTIYPVGCEIRDNNPKALERNNACPGNCKLHGIWGSRACFIAGVAKNEYSVHVLVSVLETRGDCPDPASPEDTEKVLVPLL